MDNKDKHWTDFCGALEEIIDSLDDAWEAEKSGKVSTRDRIKESRYVPSQNKLREHLDLYIDARIKEFVRDHTTAKIVVYKEDLFHDSEH